MVLEWGGVFGGEGFQGEIEDQAKAGGNGGRRRVLREGVAEIEVVLADKGADERGKAIRGGAVFCAGVEGRRELAPGTVGGEDVAALIEDGDGRGE